MDLYYTIKNQRKNIKAPVDYMGCCSIGESHQGDIKKFQILVSLLLSSQTKDEVTYKAVHLLNNLLCPLTPKNVLNTSEELVHRCIEKVGYHNKKVKFLYEISKKVQDKMPDTLLDTIRLPGIGKKMAYLYLYHGCGKIEGIGVDTNVHRISNRLELCKSKNPEETRIQLEGKFDKTEWQEINEVFVGFGQTICLPVNPKCSECSISNLCPYNLNKNHKLKDLRK